LVIIVFLHIFQLIKNPLAGYFLLPVSGLISFIDFGLQSHQRTTLLPTTTYAHKTHAGDYEVAAHVTENIVF
jgi:hypothetical protein